MNYIVFDLEWNQSFYGRSGEHPRMPFEIIEIGAVKVDEKYNIIDDFTRLIRPKVYKKLHPQVREMLNYTEEELRGGKTFQEACTEFLEWCGDDYMFCTWGSSDVYYLQNNMDFYYMNKLPFPVKYYNAQQVYADIYDKDHTICKLEKAVQKLDIPVDEPFHAAISDARYTAKVMAKSMPKNFKDMYTYDIYRHPKKKEDEIEDFHNNELDYISSEYPDKKAIMADKDVPAIKCSKCKRKAAKKVNWYQTSTTTSVAVGRCWYHGYMLCKMKFKTTGGSEDNMFAIKKIVQTDKRGFEEARDKQIELREKRKIKRHEKS